MNEWLNGFFAGASLVSIFWGVYMVWKGHVGYKMFDPPQDYDDDEDDY